MRVRLLGTGSADGWPNPWCDCASCATERAAGRRRGQTSALVDDVLLLDCGPETPVAAARQGADLRGVRHVLVTHAHPDHWAPSFLLYRSWVRDAARHPLQVVGPAEVVEQARRWVAPDSAVTFTAVSPGDRLDLDGEYDARVLAADHSVTTVLYDVTARPAGRRLLYATDTGPLPAEVLAAVRGAAYDLVLLEETFGDIADHGTRHLDLATFGTELRRLREVGAVGAGTRVAPVHLSHRNPPTPELRRRLADWGAEVLDDGDVVELGVPSAVSSAPVARRTLVLGGARSGKSREAERLLAAEPEVVYVATGYAPTDADPEWSARVARHRASRPATWHTVETTDLAGLLDGQGPPLLVDCLTLWLTRVLDAHGAWDDETWAATGEKTVAAEVDALVAAWRRTSRRAVAVSNEVGQGVVPTSASARRFRDLLGQLNAAMAAETEDVRWCVAGRVTHL